MFHIEVFLGTRKLVISRGHSCLNSTKATSNGRGMNTILEKVWKVRLLLVATPIIAAITTSIFGIKH